MKACIVNYITRNSWHIEGQQRLEESIKRAGFEGDTLLFDNENFNCVTHKRTPYAFKLFCMEEAFKKGYSQVLWLDASFWAIRSLKDIVNKIIEYKFLVQDSGYPVGQWTSDDCLDRMEINRETAFSLKMFSGGFMGIDFDNVYATTLFKKFLSYAEEGYCFRGSWKNRNNEVSSNKKVLGHRHDMSVGSILMFRAGMKMLPNNTLFNYYGWHHQYKQEKDLSEVYFVCEGGPRKLPLVKT